jgi:hypothetical protein
MPNESKCDDWSPEAAVYPAVKEQGLRAFAKNFDDLLRTDRNRWAAYYGEELLGIEDCTQQLIEKIKIHSACMELREIYFGCINDDEVPVEYRIW